MPDTSLPLAPPLRPLPLLSQKCTQGESDVPLLCPLGKVRPPSSPFCPHSHVNRACECGTTRDKAPPLCTCIPIYAQMGGRTGRPRPPVCPHPHLRAKGHGKVCPPFAPVHMRTGHVDAGLCEISAPPISAPAVTLPLNFSFVLGF